MNVLGSVSNGRGNTDKAVDRLFGVMALSEDVLHNDMCILKRVDGGVLGQSDFDLRLCARVLSLMAESELRFAYHMYMGAGKSKKANVLLRRLESMRAMGYADDGVPMASADKDLGMLLEFADGLSVDFKKQYVRKLITENSYERVLKHRDDMFMMHLMGLRRICVVQYGALLLDIDGVSESDFNVLREFVDGIERGIQSVLLREYGVHKSATLLNELKSVDSYYGSRSRLFMDAHNIDGMVGSLLGLRWDVIRRGGMGVRALLSRYAKLLNEYREASGIDWSVVRYLKAPVFESAEDILYLECL